MKRFMVLAFVFAACGGGDDGGPAKDAATGSDGSIADAAVDSGTDAAPATVVEVNCDGSEVDTVTATGVSTSGMFSPMSVTINQNDVLQFTMPASHNVVPDPTATLTDPGLNVGFNTTKCLKFTATGTFGYKCGPHSFKGSVTVQ